MTILNIRFEAEQSTLLQVDSRSRIATDLGHSNKLHRTSDIIDEWLINFEIPR